jgi:hypothetical protein
VVDVAAAARAAVVDGLDAVAVGVEQEGRSDPQRAQQGRVAALGRLAVGDADGHVVEHAGKSSRSRRSVADIHSRSSTMKQH